MCTKLLGGTRGVTEHHHVFLSYSRNDPAAAANLRGQIERCGLSVFKDDESIRAGDLWLGHLQEAVDHCGAFVVLVGRDGVRRWIGAETQAALNRYFGPHDDAQRLPIFPILLDGSEPETLPAFLRLFQIMPWNGVDPLPERLLGDIREGNIVNDDAIPFEGCPFVGLAAYRPDQAHLFFGRQKETLDALACFDARLGFPAVRWLEINGNSGSGKSSLMQAGLLPLVDQGWLWSRTGYERWRRIGPMMPGEHPVTMLAEQLARTFKEEMADVRARLQADDDRGLADWLRSRKQDGTAFLLAIDQFEELFTAADADERRRLDALLATALADAECPLFVISTVRADFLDRFADALPRLVALKNQLGKAWTLAPIGTDALREVIDGPARLAGLDVGEVRELMLADAQDEPGALPLVENALQWLWEKRTGQRLSGRLFREQGGLAGLLSRGAEYLLDGLGAQRERALELLFALVNVDADARRHTRRRLALEEAVAAAGGGARGRALVDRLAGHRRRDGASAEGALRLITITGEAGKEGAPGSGRWVNLIHETLIRSKGLDAAGNPQPYWPTLWAYIEQHMDRAVWLERLRADTRTWLERERNPGFQWSHERVREAAPALTRVGPKFEPSPEEEAFLGPIDPGSMLAELERPQTTHRRRALIGERLDMLGDPRSGVGIDAEGTPEIEWRRIEGGDVTIAIRSDPNKRLSSVVNTIKHTIKPFQLARHPITATQYRAFLAAADGWCNRERRADDLYRDPNGDSYDIGRFGNHPAVYVSWFDAMAFCRWLSRRLSLTIRLPDEWEWQQAATGGDEKNVFPWGAEWDAKQEPWRANTFESRLGGATAVGMYPSGASPQGVLDLAGTVWEWCLNKFDKPEVTKSRTDDFEYRVLRGGSWDSLLDLARSADRNWNFPNFRYNYVGFRVLCSSPIFAH